MNEECTRAGISKEDIQTGAVIVTGETAKKHNAKEIAQALSENSGKFVAATAGPNFESLLAAMGSGATARSKETGKTILSCDIGGGTSNLAVSVNGEVVSTSCISVGGRLISINPEGKISRLSEPAQKVMEHMGLPYKPGDRIQKEDIGKIASGLAGALIEVMTGPANSSLARQLMMTENLNIPETVDEYSFSGGVAEFIYGATGFTAISERLFPIKSFLCCLN